MVQDCKLTEFIANSNISEDLFKKIQEDIRTRDILSTVLISTEAQTVVRLNNALVLAANADSDANVTILDYSTWCEQTSKRFSNDYDLRRFNRSTKLETLRTKVVEHKQYSFIARIKADDVADRVMKYTFVRLTPDAKFILGTRQEITKSLEHDIVTGGLNREGFLRELSSKLKDSQLSKTKLAVLCFNIKNFRVINELHGNAIGDKVLQHMYTSIVYSELHPISYARYESDNFLCLVRREMLDTDVITRLCQQEYIEENRKIVFRSNCGIYNIDNNDVVEPVNACAHAKLAISFIKDQFITPWIVYQHQMQTSVISDSEVLDQLDGAMARNEFMPYYQPVVDVKTGRIEMAEALVRWKSEKHGMMSPAVFIPVLERHGGLSRIDQLMEQRIFSLQQKRLAAGLPVVPIDLNLSWVDFADTRLINQLQEHVLDPSVPTDLVRFEITESAYEEIAENRVDVLSFFQQNGVKLLVDDFGQGYSFGTMKNVDFHIVKLDKSLIDKIGQSRKMDLLVETLIGVFHSLNSKVVAEGVEDEKQVEYLRKVGCDYIQGFYFYRPMDEESFLALLEKQEMNERTIESISESVPTSEQDAAALWVERDVLEKQYSKMQAAVEESKCLQMLLDEMDIHIFEWDVKTHVDKASEKFCKMYGIPGNEIPNMPEEIPIVIEEDRERFRDFYGRIARGEKMGSDSFRLYTPDFKSYTWFRKTFYTIFDSKGMPTKAIITMRDCQDEYHYRMLRSRDRMLTQQQDIVTFVYHVANDTFAFNVPTPDGNVQTFEFSNYTKAPEESMSEDQKFLSAEIKRVLALRERMGHIDFFDKRLNTEFRAHYMVVDGDYGSIYAIIGTAEDINKTSERIEAREQMIRLSRFDGLTQLYNRSSGEKEMESLIEAGESGLFGILDCDRFKSVNDSFGHAVGDALLVAIAQTLKKHNPNGVNMRLGGDEFAFFVSDKETVRVFNESVASFFKEISELQVPGIVDFPISVSIGAVYYDGSESASFDALYRKADMLLYKSKEYLGNKLTML